MGHRRPGAARCSSRDSSARSPDGPRTRHPEPGFPRGHRARYNAPQRLVVLPRRTGGAAMATGPDGSVTRWLDDLKGGEGGEGANAAVQPLWERYFERLVRLAHPRLRAAPRGPADEEDVALSAFD